MKRSLGFLVAVWLAGCAGGGPTGGSGGTGGGGAGGTDGGGGSGGSGTLPNFETTFAKGKIAGKTFEFASGWVKAVAGDATAMDVELLGFSPELSDTPCWNQPPAGSNPDATNRVIFRVPRAGGTFTWGGGQAIAGFTSITLASAAGTPATQSTDRAKVMIGPWPTAVELSGSVVVKVDDNNTVNGTFTVRRCGS
jgi:hypothetical protein